MDSAKSTNVSKNGPGAVADALTTFEEQAAKLSPGATPDPNVVVAYALGWFVGDALTCAKYGFFGHLVKMPGLGDPADQWALLVRKIIFLCGKLNNHLNSLKAHPDLSDELKTGDNLLMEPPPLPGDVKTAVGATLTTVTKLHTDIIAVLWPVESSLTMSYQLGHEMEQMCTASIADPSTTVSASVRNYDAELHRLLIALASKLPANAAHATDNSLRLWSASLQVGGEESAEDLLQQGRRWHEVLAGDASGKDVLGSSDYVAAADGMTGRLWETARQVAARFKAWLIVAVVLASDALVLQIMGTRGTVAAGALTITFVLLGWRAVGELFGRVAAKGEEELWGAEIDWAIAYRFTILKNPPANSKLKPQSKTPHIDWLTKEHLRRYKQWHGLT
jgi:hypothetical protein